MKSTITVFLTLLIAANMGCISIPRNLNCVDSDGNGVCDDGQQKTTTTPSTPDNKESCEAQGGIWGQIGLMPRERCNLPARDIGKPCSSQQDCEGACIADLTEDEKETAATGVLYKNGTCTAWKITTGCQAMVEDSKVMGVICID